MRKHTSLLVALLCLCCGLSLANSSVTSVSIVKDTLQGASQCMHYKIIGMCFWLECDGPYCHVQPTLKLDHYLPDAVVSVYTKPTNNPWLYANKTIDPAAFVAGKAELENMTDEHVGFGDEHDNSNRDINNKFHEVDIIGNPALFLLSGKEFTLPSAATPYVPYYTSLLDTYAWRFPALERFYTGSLIPGIHDVGTVVIHDWGPVYPRNGYVNQPDSAKAAAVIALRASTIITEIGQPHLYHGLSNSCGAHCTAYPVKENSPNALYQLIYPKVENQCVVFGKNDITSLRPWETDATTKGSNRYLWVLWRHYHGCVPGDGKYFWSIDW